MRTLTALMLFAATPVAAGDYEDGAAAYDTGDNQKAFRLWKGSAEQGAMAEQILLGSMYAEGKGVPEDDIAAAWIDGQGPLHFQGDGIKGVIEAGGRYNETLDR